MMTQNAYVMATRAVFGLQSLHTWAFHTLVCVMVVNQVQFSLP